MKNGQKKKRKMPMKLYHGTLEHYADSIQREGVLLCKSKKHLDFGPGFYTTPPQSFAEETGRLHAKKFRMFNPGAQTGYAVAVFEADENALATLNGKRFLKANWEWGRFILANRTANESVHARYEHNTDGRYDWVAGPTADGKRFARLIDRVDKGEVGLENFDLNAFKPSSNARWGEQFSFHTPCAVACIRLVDVLYYRRREVE